VESAEIRKLAIEFVDDGHRFGGGDVETASVGENQTFLVQAQMHRVGAQPAGAGDDRSCDFTAHPESGISGILGKAESIAERRFERLRRPTRAPAARDQRVQAIAGSASTLSRSSGSGQMSSGTTRVSCMGAGRIGLQGGDLGCQWVTGCKVMSTERPTLLLAGEGSHCRKSVA
jgi:hypothetical protein